MLTIKYLREQRPEAEERLAKKHFNQPGLIDEILTCDDTRRSSQLKRDELQARMNQISKEIGQLFKAGKTTEANALKEETLKLKQEIEKLNLAENEAESRLQQLIVQIPNVPHASVPAGKLPEDNVVVKSGGQIPVLHEKALPHWDLAKQYQVIDFELGVKITGSGFPVYKGKGAMLQRALINYFLDQASLAGFTEYQPPVLVNEDSGFGTGQLPDKEGQMYHVGIDNLYLVPTAEVPLTNIFRDVILSESDFPVKITAYTPCFRREAGSYGKDVRGLNRLHQFDKVEIVVIDHPSHSYQMLEQMVNHVERLVSSLELPYRIVKLCGGDMSFTSALTYDFEVYSAAQKKWLEVSSVSNFESFQANRLKLRYRDEKDKKNVLAHTLNGSALALPRIVAALLENNQTENGIRIPEVLVPYTHFEMI